MIPLHLHAGDHHRCCTWWALLYPERTWMFVISHSSASPSRSLHTANAWRYWQVRLPHTTAFLIPHIAHWWLQPDLYSYRTGDANPVTIHPTCTSNSGRMFLSVLGLPSWLSGPMEISFVSLFHSNSKYKSSSESSWKGILSKGKHRFQQFSHHHNQIVNSNFPVTFKASLIPCLLWLSSTGYEIKVLGKKITIYFTR